MSKQVIVELIGPARIQTGRKEVPVTIKDGVTWRDVVAALAQALPVLVGNAIAEDGQDLISPYLLNLGGRRTIYNMDEQAELKAGDHLVLLEEVC